MKMVKLSIYAANNFLLIKGKFFELQPQRLRKAAVNKACN